MSKPGKAWLLGASLGDVTPCEQPDGWPEFVVTLRFYVSSNDPEVIERERRKVFEQDWRPAPFDEPATATAAALGEKGQPT